MSRFTAFFLVSIVSSQAFYNAGVLTYWFANRAYITSALCENRSHPAMHCDGKCYLRKKLAAATNPTPGDAQSVPTLQRGLDLAECPLQPTLPGFIFIAVALHAGLPPGDDRCTIGFPEEVFRPPAHQA